MAGIRRASDLGTQGIKTILDGSVQTADITNNAITQAKLDTSIPLSGMRNAIINGSFDIWQRLSGTSLTFTATANLTNYNAADRWFVGQNPTAGNLTISQATADNSQFLYGIRFGRADGQGAGVNGQVYLGQALETAVSRRFAGQTATLSFWVKRNTAGGATIPTNLNVRVYAGQGTDQSSFTWMTTGWTGQSTVLDQVVSTTGTMTRYSYSFSVPSTTKQLLLHYYYTPTTSPASGEWFQIEGVQLEVGSQATPFEQRPYGTELELCQRYYIDPVTYLAQATGIGYGGGSAYWFIAYWQTPVPMRINPNISGFSTSTLQFTSTAGQGAAVTSVLTSGSISPMRFYVIYGVSGYTTGQAMNISFSGAANSVTVSAEL